MSLDDDYMRQALVEAGLAGAAGEVPVGAVIVAEERVVARGHNRPIGRRDPSAHAEIEALRSAGQALGSYRLNDCTLYVTLEPCTMCAAALVHARMRRVVFGTFDLQAGAAGSRLDVFRLPWLNHRVDVFGGVLAQDCAEMLRVFFAGRRGERAELP